MGKGTRNIAKQLGRMRLGLILLVFFVALALVGGQILRSTLLQNAHESNTALSRYYAAETNSSLTMYRALLEFGTESLDSRNEQGNTWEELERWVRLFCTRLRSVLGDEAINVYGVVDGTPLTVGDWDEMTSTGGGATGASADTSTDTSADTATDALPAIDVTTREWYRAAMATPGETVFTDVYEDALTGQNVVTVACAGSTGNVVLAFDLYPENFVFQYEQQDLPEGASFFLCDGVGNILYSETSLTHEDGLDAYVLDLVHRIEAGELEDATSYVVDLDGRERAVDYSRLANGWYSIVTAPRAVILGRLQSVGVLFGIMVALFAVLLGALAVRDMRRARTMERTNETVRVLGNSYYAIYLVNYEESTYEMIKGSDYVRRRIPKRGPYESLLRTAAEVIERDTFEEFEESFSADNIRMLVAGRVRDYGGDFQRRFGDSYRWVNVRVLYDESLDPEEVVLCFREVDQEKQRQLQERHYLEEALESSRASIKTRQAFFNNMSHDMRTPLNGIIGLTELARAHTDDPAAVAGYLDRIDRSSQQLLALINDILDVARMEQGSVSLATEQMDLAQVIDDCAEPFRLQAAREGKSFELACDVADAHVLGDPLRFSQVLNNLLSNALKYTDPGDTVHVRAEQLSDAEAEGGVATYRITVKDTGIGMSPEFLERLFDLYAREQRFGTRETVGTGLGMPITKNLVEQMGGALEVQSEVDQGSTFTVTVPFAVVAEDAHAPSGDAVPGPAGGSAVAAADADAVPAAADAAFLGGAAGADAAPLGGATGAAPRPAASATPHVAAPAPTAEELLASLAGKRVLVAEDNAINMEIATEMLGMAGLETARAWNGREAVDAFAASAPGYFDAVLLDMKMPEMDGCAAARAIRALDRPDATAVPLVAVTANAFAEDIVATTAAGMDAHVSKPIDFSLLCQTLAELMAARGDAGARAAGGSSQPARGGDAG